MKRTVKKILDRYATTRIDRALDDAVPLTGWTAWYVLRTPELREYYENMLEMELELRFPEAAPNAVRVEQPYTVSEKPKRRVLSIPVSVPVKAAAALLSAACLLLVFGFLPRTEPVTKPVPMTLTTKRAEEPSIDLSELLALAVPTEEFWPSRDDSAEPEDRSSALLDRSVASFVRFSEKPLESTLSFLESAHIITRRHVDSDDL